MGFVVLHMEKAHGSDSGTTAHIERFIIPKNADPTRTHLNRKLIEYPEGVKDRSAAIQRRLEEAGLTRKIGSNQVRAIRINVSATPEDMERIEREGRLDEWCADNLKYFADTFGKENIVAAHLHLDEKTPHMHVTLVPWKIQCKLPPKTKRFCPLKTFNNAPLKSLDRWGYYYFRFSSVRLNRLRNKLLANYLKSGGNELATVRISAFCVAMLSNNSFISKYSIFFRKYELSAAVL